MACLLAPLLLLGLLNGVALGSPCSLPQSDEPLPGAVPPSWLSQAVREIAASEYHFDTSAAGELSAPNRAQGLRSTLRAGALLVEPRDLDRAGLFSLTLETSALVRGEARHLTPATLAAESDGGRLELAREGVLEWFVNDERGLQQGWTISSRPHPAERGELVVEVTLRGLAPRLAADGRSALLMDPAGTVRLHYTGLRAWDARGRELSARMVPMPGGIAIEVLDSAAEYPITIDPLLGTAAWSGESDQAGAEFGVSVATAGDVNGDGFSDVVIGASKYDNGEVDEGRAFVFHGSAGGPSLSPDWTAESDVADAQFGTSVSAAGDVNADGFSDVIVGAPLYDGTLDREGAAYVYFGSSAGLGTAAGWALESGQENARFGVSVARAGDVNGDGYDDIVVGIQLFDSGETNEGGAAVFHGSSSGPSLAADWVGEGGQDLAQLGSRVDGAGDINADGFDDLVVGIPRWDSASGNEGQARAYLGGVTGLSLAPAWTFTGSQVGEQVGSSVSGVGDVNGDGYADVLVGAALYNGGETDEGRADLFLGGAAGLSLSPDWSIEGDQEFATLGSEVGSAGDVDGDGYADILIGAPLYDGASSNQGRAYMFRGSAAGPGASADWTNDGTMDDALYGSSVAAAGDVNGDGYGDVIVGSRLLSNGETGEGGAYIYYGDPSNLSTSSAWSATSAQSGSEYATALAYAGDVNGDGYSDVIVGAPRFDNGEVDEGQVFVYHGSSAGLSLAADWTAERDQGNARYGTSVAGAGDVNADGYDDIIVGAFLWDGGSSNEGLADVYLGSATGLLAAPGWSFEPDQDVAHAGYSVATAGDVNGDGFADVVVGVRRYTNGEADEGGAFVFHGSASGPSALADWVAEGDSAGAEFGGAVASAGDVNGDGYSDLIVGAPQFTDGQTSEGSAFVFHGSAAGLSPAHDWETQSHQSFSLLGIAVSSAGDVNGDGYSDVIVGASLWDSGNTNEGAAFQFSGSASGLGALPDWTREGNQDNATLGESVAAAGDVNGDGYGDVIVGSRLYDLAATDNGIAAAFLGSAGGLLNGAWVSIGGAAGEQHGASVAGPGDVNGDGFADVLVGAPLATASVANEGAVKLYLGGNGGGPPRGGTQRTSDDARRLGLHGEADASWRYRIQADANGIGGFAGSTAGRERVGLEWEAKPLGETLDGSDLGSSVSQVDTGAIGGSLTLNELVSGVNSATAYQWRARITTRNPEFPHGTWFSMAGNSMSESKLRLAVSPFPDCNNNGVDDALDIAGATSSDCNVNGIPDECEVASGTGADCNENGLLDACDLAFGTSLDCNANSLPDECETDCNQNGVPDDCDISGGGSVDCNSNGVPDECEPDCNSNGVADSCDITGGTSLDCNFNGVPDECELDCNLNGVPDDCDISLGTSPDCNSNAVPDECDITLGTSQDSNTNAVPDECEDLHFCPTGPNSTGGAAIISSNGAYIVGDNQFVLTATPVPNEPGIFFYSAGKTNGGAGVPFGNGFRCVGNSADPSYRLLPAGVASGNALVRTVDFGSVPIGGEIFPGSTWNFQAWYRDPAAGGASFDLSDAITCTFQ